MFPESNATGDLMTSLAEGLTANGFRVTAYCAQPSYYGAEKVPSLLRHAGVTIKRPWSTRFGRRTIVARAIDAATFIMRLLLELSLFRRDALVIAVTNPPFLPLIGALRKAAFGSGFVLIVHDVYPEIAVQLGVIKLGGVAHRILKALDRFVLSHADAVVVLGRDMAERIGTKVPPLRRDRIVLIPNWADAKRIAPMAKSESRTAQSAGLLDTFVVQYSGNIGLSQQFDVILEAAQRLSSANVTFTFVGGGTQTGNLAARVQALRLRNVRFLNRASVEHVGESLAACDAGLVPLMAGLEGLSVPSKYYGILASARPVLALMSPEAEVAVSVAENACGFVVPPGDAEALAAAISALAADEELRLRLGRNARATFERLYTYDRALTAYREVLFSVKTVGLPLAPVHSRGVAP
jgi:glycosyltransferase involved in cell wall biosynthesis